MRLGRRVLLLGSALATTAALALVAALAVLHTAPGRALVRDRLAAALAAASGGRVTVGALETPELGMIVLRDLVLSLGGQSVVRVARVEIALGLPLPVPPTLEVRRLAIDGLTARLVRRDGGFGATPPAGEPSNLHLRIANLSVRNGRVGVHLADAAPPHRGSLSAIALDGALEVGPQGQHLQVTSLTGRPRGVPLPSFAVAATARRVRDGALRVDGLRLELAAAGAIALRARLDPTATPPRYRITAATDDLVPGALRAGWPSEPLRGRGRAQGYGLTHRAHGRFDSAAGHLTWSGRAQLGPTGTYRVHGNGEVRDLARLGAGTSGRFPFRLEVAGSDRTARGGRTRLQVEIGSGTIGDLSIRRATASGHLEGSRLRVESARADSGDVGLAGDGVVDLSRGIVEADLDVTLAGRGSARARLALARQRRVWAGTVRSLRLTPRHHPSWESAAPAALRIGGGVQVRDLRLGSEGQRATLDVELAPRGVVRATLAVADLELAPLCALAATPCDGRASGRLEAAGTTRAPTLALTASARDVVVGPLARSSVDATLRHERGRATGTIEFAGAGGSFVVTGAAPVPLPGLPAGGPELDLDLTARRFNLARLAVWSPAIVRSASGRVRADLHVGGTWHAPRPEGTLTLRAPRLELAPSGARWRNVEVVLRADGGTRLAIERLHAEGGRGTLTGTGAFDFRDGLIPTADVRLVLDRFLAVDRPVLEASCNGTVRIRERLDAPTIRGRLYIPQGALRPAFLPAANAPTEPDPTIEVVGLPNSETSGTPPAGLGRLTLGLTVTLGNGMRIRRRDADIQLGGTLRLERVPPEPIRMHGTVEVERGWYTFSGRRFRVRDGAVRFAGGPIGDAELDLEATRRTGDFEVTVAVQGTVARPVLLLSSDPPLDETDVLAVLIVGRPGGELNDSERLTVQAEAASLAMGYMFPGLAGEFGEALPLEQVQVSPEEIRIGHRIGNDVYISLSQQFVGWAGQTMAIEYAITRRLSVELSTSSRGSGAVDFFWRRRY